MDCVACPQLRHGKMRLEGKHDWREGLKVCTPCRDLIAVAMIERGDGRHVHPRLRRRLERQGKVTISQPGA